MNDLLDGCVGNPLGLPVYANSWINPGDVFMVDGAILAKSAEYVLIKLWVADMARDLRRNLVTIVAEAEARLFGPSAAKEGPR